MSCADVCLSHDYDGDNAFHSAKIVKARRSYRCVECRCAINPGDLYERASGKSERLFFTVQTCRPCAEIRNAFVCGSFCYEMLWESICEEMFPVWRKKGAWDCLAKLTTPEAVAKCNAKYAEWLKDCCDDEYAAQPDGGTHG